jgi:SAM-dependent methyltransferase
METLGYRYYGVDYAGAAADDLVDAHALPYADSTFDLIFAIALLEHLAQAARVIQEVQRVLNASRYFIGTAAFLEPFHDNSFSHLSPLGLSNALQSSGFAVEAILAIRGWNVIRAQLEMGFERARLPRWIPQLLSQPFVWAMEAYALAGRSFASDKSRHTRDAAYARHAGAFFFVARKPR